MSVARTPRSPSWKRNGENCLRKERGRGVNVMNMMFCREEPEKRGRALDKGAGF